MAQKTETTRLAMIVDGDYLYKAFKEVLGRPPRSYERTNFEHLKRYAARLRPGGYLVTARYFQRRQPADKFYHALSRFGYELILTEYEDFESWRIVKRNIIGELEQLRATDDDVLYVGGDSYAGEITEALRDLDLTASGNPRQLMVAHFERRTDFDLNEFNSHDIVTDIEAAPPRVYQEDEERTRYPQDYREQTPRPAALPTASRGALSSALLDALRAAGPANDEMDEDQDHSSDWDDDDWDDPIEEDEIENSGRDQDTAAPPTTQQRNVLVLIDAENIDGHLAEIIAPKQLERHTRPQWDKLVRFSTDRANGGQLQVKSFHQNHDTIYGFANYLRNELGIDPVLIYPESDPSEQGKRRPVVDEGILQVLQQAAERYCDVFVVSHDAGYLEQLIQLHEHETYSSRRFAMIGFADLMPTVYHQQSNWLELVDLERDVGAFSYRLPNRISVVYIDDFDAAASLGDFALTPPEDASSDME